MGELDKTEQTMQVAGYPLGCENCIQMKENDPLSKTGGGDTGANATVSTGLMQYNPSCDRPVLRSSLRYVWS